MERAFNAGTDPITPALHSAINKSGLEIMKSGAAITGSRRVSKIVGKLMARDLYRGNIFRFAVQVLALDLLIYSL